ncbi:MAG: hypothetical protein LBU77_01595, partial [Clostridiales bacterium]|nr:hypothetical protein [Clostridiales bacterium]
TGAVNNTRENSVITNGYTGAVNDGTAGTQNRIANADGRRIVSVIPGTVNNTTIVPGRGEIIRAPF